MDLEHGVAYGSDAAWKRAGRGVSVLLAPRRPAVAGFFLVRRPVRIARVLHRSEEAIFGAEHVRDDLAQWPVALPRDSVEILVAHAGECAGQVAIGVVVLAEDALRLRGRRGPHRGKPNSEIAQLVLRHEECEPKSLFVVLAPYPCPVHLRVGQIDGRAYERLDGLRDGR